MPATDLPLGYSPSNTPANCDLDVVAVNLGNVAGTLAQATDLLVVDTLVLRDPTGRVQLGQTAFNTTYDVDRLVAIGGVWNGAVEAHGFGMYATLVPVANASAHGISSEPTFQKAAGGNHAVFSSAWFRTPVILAGGATIGTVTVLYVTGPPSGGNNNYSVFVEGGTLRVGGGALPSSVVIGWQTAPVTELTVSVEAGASIDGPDGMVIQSRGNAVGQTAGLYIMFGGQNSSCAGITAIQQDVATLAADMVFLTRSTAGGGTTAVRWRIMADGHLVPETDNVLDVGALAGARPRNVYTKTGVFVGERITMEAATSLILNSQAASAGRIVLAGGANGGVDEAGAVQVVGVGFGGGIDGFVILNAANFAGSKVSIQRNGTAVAEFGAGIGFFNTPIAAQAGAIIDAAGGVTQDAEARTALNALLAAHRNYGLIAP